MLVDYRPVWRHFESLMLVSVLDMVFAGAVVEEVVVYSRLELCNNPKPSKFSFLLERMDRMTMSIRLLDVTVTGWKVNVVPMVF